MSSAIMPTPDSVQAQGAPLRRAKTLAREVAASLTEMIRNGTFEPGAKLPTESALMAAQGVSRTVIREAISSMQAAGLVETRHGIGTFVLETPAKAEIPIDLKTISTMRDLLSLLELRISLETESAGLAAARRSDEQLKEIRRALDTFWESLQSGEDAIGADFHFHLQIAHATGNHYFIEIMSHLGQRVIPRSRLNTAEIAHAERAKYLDRVQREHEDIFDAIARRDSEAARAAMRNHLTNSRERLRRAHERAEAGKPA